MYSDRLINIFHLRSRAPSLYGIIHLGVRKFFRKTKILRTYFDHVQSQRIAFNDCFLLTLSFTLTLLKRRSLSYRKLSIDLQSESKDWFLYDKDLCYERVNL